MNLKTNLLLFSLLINGILLQASPRFSVAGFYPIKETGREVYSMNPGWRLYKGDVSSAHEKNFDDTGWKIVSLPNGIEELPVEASGSINYQGIVWYRKHFDVPQTIKGKKLFLHFEAIMGKSKIWINGQFVKEHFGGYLPIVIDATSYLNFDDENVIAVCADNSNDPNYPPGKPQSNLDFVYFGGIYRDCWLIAHNYTYITDTNYANKVAGGGVFVSFGKVSENRAEIIIDTEVKNENNSRFQGKTVYELFDKNNRLITSGEKKLSLEKGKDASIKLRLTVNSPHLWSPENPYLYNLNIYVKDARGNIVDGYRKRVGIRSIEFKGKDGFWLNGKPYEKPLIGANRHQDYAVVGNALSNSLHWRDALKLRRAGLKVIRNAHYPQDPAFMDACDELGLFVIINTPGWQFWNQDSIFEHRVYDDIRNMVRRDRNHPSVWLWEPILNETYYPDYFAKKTKDIVDEEYPYPYCYSASDFNAKGSEHFPILFMHPLNSDKSENENFKGLEDDKTYFTREWGDNVDDWSSHNSPSRVSRNWGEIPMLIQAQHYASPTYDYTSFDALYKTSRQHMGGCLWHSFDHQRGYHPDPFYGGIMDAFRQPKLSYYMFSSQRNPHEKSDLYEAGPMVYITNSMTPFSPKDVIVYSNCDEVRLTVFKNGETFIYKKESRTEGMPYPVITFKNAFDIMQDKALSRNNKQMESFLLAEGYIDGKLVAEHKVFPSRRINKINLNVDSENMPLKADGGDLITVIASVVDANGNIKRLNNAYIYFEIEGQGEILNNPSEMLNPVPVQWGTAPILVRSTTQKGDIKIKARLLKEGEHIPANAELLIQSLESDYPMIFSTHDVEIQEKNTTKVVINKSSDCEQQLLQVKQELNNLKLKEVSKQQEEFEGVDLK